MIIRTYAKSTKDKYGFAVIFIPMFVIQWERYENSTHLGIWCGWLIFDAGIEISNKL